MAIANRVVAGILRSPFHRLLSGTTDLIRYEGRRTGRQVVMPTQYVRAGDEVIVLVGRPDTKSWWRNFEGGRRADVLVSGRWSQMEGTVVSGADDPATTADLLSVYLQRFPRAGAALGPGTSEERASAAVLVRFRPG